MSLRTFYDCYKIYSHRRNGIVEMYVPRNGWVAARFMARRETDGNRNLRLYLVLVSRTWDRRARRYMPNRTYTVDRRLDRPAEMQLGEREIAFDPVLLRGNIISELVTVGYICAPTLRVTHDRYGKPLFAFELTETGFDNAVVDSASIWPRVCNMDGSKVLMPYSNGTVENFQCDAFLDN